MEHCELTRWLSGDLTAMEKTEYQQHLALCPSCQNALTERLTMEDALVFLEAPIKPPRSTWKAIRNRVDPRRPRNRRVSYAFAALSLGVMVGAWSLHHKAPTAPPVFATNQLEARLTSSNPAIHGTAVLNLTNHHLTVRIHGLATLPAGHLYELWTVKGNQEEALGALNLKTHQASFSGLAHAGSGYELVICPTQSGWAARTTLGPVAAKGAFTAN